MVITSMKKLLKSWQEKGVPLFFVRNEGKPSVTLTLVVLSTTFIMFGLVNGAANLVKGIDMQSALYWHGLSLAAYLGRRFSKREGLGDSIKQDEEK